MKSIRIEGLGFEIYSKDLKKVYNWKKAKKKCKKLGSGWRLPTKEELNEMYKNKDRIGGFAFDYYWSSTEIDSIVAWNQNFNFGNQGRFNKVNDFKVRAVRGINYKEETIFSLVEEIIPFLNEICENPISPEIEKRLKNLKLKPEYSKKQ